MEVWPQLSGSCRRFFCKQPRQARQARQARQPRQAKQVRQVKQPRQAKQVCSADETACSCSAQASSRSYNVIQQHGVTFRKHLLIQKDFPNKSGQIFLPASQLSLQISWSQLHCKLRFKEFCLSSHSYFLWHTVNIFCDTQSVFSVTNNS